MLKPAPSTLNLSTFSAIFLMSLFAAPVTLGAPPSPHPTAAADDDPDAAPTPEATGLPAALTDPNSPHMLAGKCQASVNGWVNVKNEAQAELAACNLHRFNDACLRLAVERKKVLAKDAPCMKIPEAKEKIAKIPELNCNIINVPGTCSSK